MTRMINARQFLAVSAALAATAVLAADPQVTGEVTVQAQRPTTHAVGRSSSGVPMVVSSVEYRVAYSDLELSIPSNAKVLKARVHDAARAACADLDRLHGQPTAGTDECTRKAEHAALPQVLSAIAAAESRKTAAE